MFDWCQNQSSKRKGRPCFDVVKIIVWTSPLTPPEAPGGQMLTCDGGVK